MSFSEQKLLISLFEFGYRYFMVIGQLALTQQELATFIHETTKRLILPTV